MTVDKKLNGQQEYSERNATQNYAKYETKQVTLWFCKGMITFT